MLGSYWNDQLKGLKLEGPVIHAFKILDGKLLDKYPDQNGRM
jgi:hypothetical protein